jgi:hypothetical protein
MAVVTMEAGALVVGLAECKAALRLERDDEDAVLAGHIRTAMALCEAFIGQWMIEREGEQRLACDLAWQRLQVAPVQAITGVFLAGDAVAASAWESDIGADGTGWVRLVGLPAGATATTLVVRWNAVPEPLRAGIVRLVSHLFSHRDAADAGPPPAAVAALWRPWRRLQLG